MKQEDRWLADIRATEAIAERDRMKRQLERKTELLASTEAQIGSLISQRERYREALERIAKKDSDWVDWVFLRSVARKALAADGSKIWTDEDL